MLYWLELERPLDNSINRIYAGYARDYDTFKRRMKDHVKGRGAVFTRQAVKLGIKFKCVCIFPDGTRQDERNFKAWKCNRRVVARFKKLGFGPWL